MSEPRAHDTKTGRKIDLYIRNPDAPNGGPAWATHTDRHVHANRYGNGDAASGDGGRYRGRGLKQITFLANYRECGHALDLDLTARPRLLVRDEYAALSAGWYW